MIGFLHSAVDLPMITAQAVQDLLAHDDPDADIVAGLVSEAVFLGVYPSAPYRALAFREGNFLNASVSVMRVGFLQQHAPLLHKLAELRKSVIRSLWHLSLAFHYQWFRRGLPALVRFATGRLSVYDLPPLAERTIYAKIRFYLSVMPELVYDVDTVEDYKYARLWIADWRRRQLGGASRFLNPSLSTNRRGFRACRRAIGTRRDVRAGTVPSGN